MMDFEEFTEQILGKVGRKATGKFAVQIRHVKKNNDVPLTGIASIVKGNNMEPCVYLDGLYEEYKSGHAKMQEIVDEIYGLFIEDYEDGIMFDADAFGDWETVKHNIRAKLINASQNKERLKNIPHRMFLDLAVAYYVKADDFWDKGYGSIPVNDQHMKAWGKEEENLYETAISNMLSEGEPCFASFEDILKQMVRECTECTGMEEEPEKQPDIGMYILTNRCRKYGAVEILNKSVMHSIAEQIGDKFVVLPSSLHEVIVLKADKKMDYERFANMVREVNDTQLSEEERLSDHVYIYSRSEETLKVVA